ncbi:hypothetical protein, partial [Helicobacter typhlonius]|uniref:hypothetical protein n=1 Tax=Helicobacter typhlonius TaxID=76936 RepID=UPI002FE3C930
GLGDVYKRQFFICNYKKLSWNDLKNIKIPLICFALVLLLGLCTLFDTITPNTMSQMFKKINSHILGWIALFFIMFFMSYIHQKIKSIFYYYYLD